ncbi:MAG: AAA family ATPase, partial [Clostridia bacterium]|nr:AAA family ATPase [Clostridia bacterium]
MLLTLNIKNAALIEDLTLNIDEGMTVLTGETGAGKSIIIDSINLIMGARTDKTIVRYGEKKTVIQAVFSFDGNLNFEEYGIDADDTVIINREISADGKSICRVNGVIVPQAFVREITENLINIHGQHDNQALLVPSKHIDFLDRYAKNEELLAEYGRVYEKKLYTENKIKSLLMDEAEKTRKIDLLSYQVD